MKLLYKNKKIEKICTNLSNAKKFFGNDQRTVLGLYAVVNFIKNSETLYSVVMKKNLNFHALQGEYKGCYAMDIVNRKSPWRLIVQILDGDEKVVSKADNLYLIAKNIKIIKVEEVSKHYE